MNQQGQHDVKALVVIISYQQKLGFKLRAAPHYAAPPPPLTKVRAYITVLQQPVRGARRTVRCPGANLIQASQLAQVCLDV